MNEQRNEPAQSDEEKWWDGVYGNKSQIPVLSIKSDGKGAAIFLDGVMLKGVQSLRLSSLPHGRAKLEVELCVNLPQF